MEGPGAADAARTWQAAASLAARGVAAEEAQAADGSVLLGNLHEHRLDDVRVRLRRGYTGPRLGAVLQLEDLALQLGEGDEEEVVELALRQLLVEALHHIPRPVANADHDDG